MGQLGLINLPAGLEQNVLLRLDREQKKRAKIQLIIFGLVDLMTLAGLVVSIVFLSNLFAQSGFFQYLFLIFSDGSLLFSFGQELLMSLIESLPIWGAIIFFSFIIILVWSLAKTISQARVFLLPV
ncbi:MAG TPA: hypothetical protein P5274_02615 [Candidatus Paceibacterota bacterium]|nr:hypothetical protein [Candidatus Paceibacterota bacterium]